MLTEGISYNYFESPPKKLGRKTNNDILRVHFQSIRGVFSPPRPPWIRSKGEGGGRGGGGWGGGVGGRGGGGGAGLV